MIIIIILVFVFLFCALFFMAFALLSNIVTKLDEEMCHEVSTIGATCLNHVGVCSTIKADGNKWKEVMTLPESGCKIIMPDKKIVTKDLCSNIIRTCNLIRA